MRKTLRPYQAADIERTVEEFGGRVILAWDLGTGKTLAASRVMEDRLPGVIVCKTSLVIQWIRHLEDEGYGALGETIGSVVVRRSDGSYRASTPGEKMEMLKRRPPFDWYVLTYATIRRVKATKERHDAKGSRTQQEIWSDVAAEKGWSWSGKRPATPRRQEYPLPPARSVAFDEASEVRGHRSQQYAGAYQLAVATQSRKAAERALLLTSTPIWRESDNLYALLRLLDPGRFRSYWDFVSRYCQVEETDFGTKVVGGKHKRIAKLLEKYMIKRDYGDPEVNISVPDVIEEEIWTYLTPANAKAYDALTDRHAQEREAGYGVGSGIAEYSKITAHDKNKLEALDDVLAHVEEPFAVFGYYRDTVDLLARHIGLPAFMGGGHTGAATANPLTGSGGRRASGGGGNRFTRTDEIKGAGSFAATIGCIREGADLSHIRNVIFYETEYTPGAMKQVLGRFARWRQDNSTDPVHSWYVLAAATVDELAFDASKDRGATIAAIEREIERRRTAALEKS